MCGRYANGETPEAQANYFATLALAKLWKPTRNAAPRQMLPVIIQDGTDRKLDLARWGWQSNFSSGGWLPPNVVGEEAKDKRTFKEAIRQRRCIIPATAFIEWLEHENQPYAFALKNRQLFGIGGIWQFVDGEIRFLLITTPANEIVSPIHHRMALMMPREHEGDWLNPSTPFEMVEHLIKPLDPKVMERWPISKKIGKFENDWPEILEPVPEPPKQQSLF